LKDKNLKLPNVIIDESLRVLDSNSHFRDLVGEKKNWNKKTIKITELIEIEKLNQFKKYLQELEQTEGIENHFNASLKTKTENPNIIVTISKLEDKHSKWSNQLFQLTCSEIINSEEIIKLQEELDACLRELGSYRLLLSQKNRLLDFLLKQIESILPLSNQEIKSVLQKMIANINSQKIFDENWENLKHHYVNIDPIFLKKIRDISDKITEKDLRHCSFIKRGFSVKETSQLLFLQPKSVEMARYRIKKKLNLKQNQNLVDFIRKL